MRGGDGSSIQRRRKTLQEDYEAQEIARKGRQRKLPIKLINCVRGEPPLFMEKPSLSFAGSKHYRTRRPFSTILHTRDKALRAELLN